MSVIQKITNQKLPPTQKPFSVAIRSEGFQRLLEASLTDPERRSRFIASVCSAVGTNPALQECDPGTIVAAALLGDSLNLSPSPQLGQFYLVPFADKKNNRTTATFILGYRGLLQLAFRSGYYKKLIVKAFKEGELISWNELDEEIVYKPIRDEGLRESLPTVGYYAGFEYINGFQKKMYWSKSKMEQHAQRYSPAFNLESYRKFKAGKTPANEAWKYSSHWYQSFDDMAQKTMIRQLISKWGITSIEFTTALEADERIIQQEATTGAFVVEDEPPTAEAVETPQEQEKQPKTASKPRGKDTPNATYTEEVLYEANFEDVEVDDVLESMGGEPL